MHSVLKKSGDNIQRLSAFSLIECLLQAFFWLNAHETLNDLAVFEDHQGWNAAHAQAGCRVWAIVDIDFTHFDRALVFGSQFLDNRGNHPAGPAPGGPEIDQYGQG